MFKLVVKPLTLSCEITICEDEVGDRLLHIFGMFFKFKKKIERSFYKENRLQK